MEPSGSTPTTWQVGIFSLIFLPIPAAVPPVPADTFTEYLEALFGRNPLYNGNLRLSCRSFHHIGRLFLRLSHRNVQVDCQDCDTVIFQKLNYTSSA